MSTQFETKNLILRELNESCIETYLANLSEKLRTILGISSVEAERTYLEQQLQKVNKGTTFFFCLWEKQTETFVGMIEIRDPAYRSQCYSWLSEPFWGCGYFQEALQIILSEYCKKHSDQTMITACIDVSNQRSYHAFKKVGFTEVRRTKGPREDQYHMVFLCHC